MVLLGAVVTAVLVGHRHVRPAVSVAVGVAVGVVTRIVSIDPALNALDPLAAPLGFLVAAVPVAVLLDRVGFFEVVAEWIADRPFAQGARLVAWLWVFAALVVVVFNLDAAIVLLTPLYLRIARRHGLDPVAVGFQPVLLASLASSVLPVSNLTNLIVTERMHVGALDFLQRAAPVSVVATVVGWLAYRGEVRRTAVAPFVPVPAVAATDAHTAARAWRIGAPFVGLLLAGFTAGDALGVPAWAVATAVAAGLMLATGHVPWRSLPVEAVVIAGGLAVLAAAAVPHLGLRHVLAGAGPLADLRAFAVGVIGANTVNNLPALLVGLPDLAPDTTWAYLTAVNTAPVLWVSGSLAGLLWIDIMNRNGHPVSVGHYARVGLRVGAPALVASAAVAVAVGHLGG